MKTLKKFVSIIGLVIISVVFVGCADENGTQLEASKDYSEHETENRSDETELLSSGHDVDGTESETVDFKELEQYECSSEVMNSSLTDTLVQVDDIVIDLGESKVEDIVSKFVSKGRYSDIRVYCGEDRTVWPIISNKEAFAEYSPDLNVLKGNKISIVIYFNDTPYCAIVGSQNEEDQMQLKDCPIKYIYPSNMSLSNTWYFQGLCADGSNVDFEQIDELCQECHKGGAGIDGVRSDSGTQNGDIHACYLLCFEHLGRTLKYDIRFDTGTGQLLYFMFGDNY